MKHKPYSRPSNYDIDYLKICRELFDIINGIAIQYTERIPIDKKDCRELAYIMTAYFEDRVNNIGFWESLVSLNKKHFGKRLPFFDNKELEN